MLRITFHRLIVPLCLFSVYLTEASPQIDQLFLKYKSSKTSHYKAQVIRTLVKDVSLHDENERNVIEKIIRYGLNDRQASVVQEAIFATGRFKINSLTPELHELYRNGCKQYPGNQSIIKQKIIRAFSKIGGNKKDDLFIEELNRKTVCHETQMILSSFIDDEKCSKEVMSSVISFRDAILNVLKDIENTPENAIRYSQHRMILSLANTLITKNTQSE